MASNIGTLGTFNTVNMKPETDEQIDSLWGQNVGDNLGALWAKNDLLASVYVHRDEANDPDRAGTWDFQKRQPFDIIWGTLNGAWNGVSAGADDNGTLLVDGTVVAHLVITDNTGVSDDAVGFSWDASHLVNNDYFKIICQINAEADDVTDTILSGNVWARP